MKDIKKVILGALLLAVGVILALNAFGVTDINIFFDGWWTLFIIVPSLVAIFKERDKTAGIFGLILGVLLLLSQLDVIDISWVWKIIIPAILVIVAIKMIINGSQKKENSEDDSVKIVTPGNVPSSCAIFGGKELNFDGRVFEGIELTAVFGGIDCDLSNAIIEKDCKIQAVSIFGGIDIIVPRNVNVVMDSTSIFGGADDDTTHPENPIATVYIENTNVFGGLDVKN